MQTNQPTRIDLADLEHVTGGGSDHAPPAPQPQPPQPPPSQPPTPIQWWPR
jgi:hypothetical protein